MGNIEKNIVITNETEATKQILVETGPLKQLNSKLDQDLRDAFGVLKSHGVNIFSDTSEIIQKNDGSLVICEIKDKKLYPRLKIKGKNLEETKDLTKRFVQYRTKEELNEYVEEKMVKIIKEGEVNKIIVDTRKGLAEVKEKEKPAPTDKEVGRLIYNTYKTYKDTKDQKYSLLEQMKLRLEPWQKANLEMLDVIREEQYNDLDKIRIQFENSTGWNAKKYETDDLVKNRKDVYRLPAAKDMLTKWDSQLANIQTQFDGIIRLTTDIKFLNGEYTLSQDDLRKYGVSRVGSMGKILRNLNTQLDADKKKSEIMMRIAVSDLEDQDFKRLTNYLEKVDFKEINPVKEKFVPENFDKVQTLVKGYPELGNYIILEQKLDQKKNGNVNQGSTGGNIDTGKDQGINKTPANAEQAKAAGEYKDRLDAFGRGGVAGLGEYGLDKTSMTPSQKRTWETVGNLALTGGMIFVGWKMISSAWKLLRGTDKADPKKQTKNWQRLLGPAGVILASNVATGESPLALIKGGKATKWMSDLIGGWFGKKAPETASVVETKYLRGFTGVTALFSGYKYEEVAEFLEEKNGIMKIKAGANEDMLKLYEKNPLAVAFLNSIGEDDDKNLVHLGLTAMGIKSVNDLQKTPRDSFNETAAGAIDKLQTITFMMKDKNYDSINPDAMDDLEAYIANKDAKEDALEALEARGDVFERNEDLKDNTGMAEKIKEITQGDTKKETALLRALNKFYSQMPEGSKKVEISGTRPTIEFKTYDSITPINLENKEIEGLAKFPGQLELFKAANLTNYIKKTFKDKQAHSIEPFTVSSLGKDVEFNNTKTWSFAIDTEVISAGPGGTLEKISPTLENKKEAYAKYLNAHVEFKKPAVA